MIKKENNEFDNYMEWFKNLEINEKREEVYNLAKILATVTSDLSNSVGVEDSVLINKDLLEVYNKYDKMLENDFLEALLVLLSSTQKSLTKYNNGISDLLEERINIIK